MCVTLSKTHCAFFQEGTQRSESLGLHSLMCTSREPTLSSYFDLTVKAIVDAVDDVISRGWESDKTALVLLDDLLLARGHSWDLVNVTYSLVRAVGSNLTGSSRVHARELEVNADIRVVDINRLGTTEVRDVFVIPDCVGGGSTGKEGGSGHHGAVHELLPGFGVEGRGGGGRGRVRREGGDDAVIVQSERKSKKESAAATDCQ